MTGEATLGLMAVLEAMGVTAAADDVPATLEARYNIAPSMRVLAAFERAGRDGGAPVRGVAMLRWGLVPHWATDASIGTRLSNARAETIATTPAFRDAWKQARRCLVPADVFYEWSVVPDPAPDADAPPARRSAKPVKQPWAIGMRDGATFCFGGLWSTWRGPTNAGEPMAPLHTCTLITTTPNALVAPIHDRMPVLVSREHWGAWLSRETPLEIALGMLVPYDASAMRAWRVSRAVNSPRNDSAELVRPIE
ncbi:MAG: SOS response-associated peptidase [Gemmatimonadaceae bacterium]|nr:SOS response-associated peptidase [Gemmatimonadaceae bacterium]